MPNHYISNFSLRLDFSFSFPFFHFTETNRGSGYHFLFCFVPLDSKRRENLFLYLKPTFSWRERGRSRYHSRNASYHYTPSLFIRRLTEIKQIKGENKKEKMGRKSLRSLIIHWERKQKCAWTESELIRSGASNIHQRFQFSLMVVEVSVSTFQNFLQNF